VMVAAHDWDIAGAMAAGCAGVFVQRSGQLFSSAFAPPTVSVADLEVGTPEIIDRFG
jgi:2-haloacid dehalogenase